MGNSRIPLEESVLLGLFAASAVLAAASADFQTAAETFGGRAGQALLWESISRLRAFLALHSLLGSLLALLVSIPAIVLRLPGARYLFLCGILGLLLFYRIEPRFRPDDWRYVLRAVLLLLGGGVAYSRAFAADAPPGSRGDFLWGCAKLLIVFGACVVAGNFIGAARLAADWREVGVSMTLFSAGSLIQLMFCKATGGSSSEHMPGRDPASRRKQVLFFAAHTGIFMVMSAVVAQGAWSERLIFACLTPATTFISGIYGAWTWFQLSGPPQLFSSSAGLTEFARDDRARIFLSVFFQYLSLGAVAGIWLALKCKSRLLIAAAHVILFCYLLPNLWFARQGL